jgi:hypothetical protein
MPYIPTWLPICRIGPSSRNYFHNVVHYRVSQINSKLKISEFANLEFTYYLGVDGVELYSFWFIRQLSRGILQAHMLLLFFSLEIVDTTLY